MGKSLLLPVLDNGDNTKTIIAMNAQGLVTRNSKRKIEFLEELTQNEKIDFMNICETWYSIETGNDDQIKGYQNYRSDRTNRNQGGTVIYGKDTNQGKIYEKYSNTECELIAVEFEAEKLVNIVIYRPPNTKEFDIIIDKLDDICRNHKDWNILISGDFNFPFVEWKERIGECGCIYTYKKESNSSAEDKRQFEKLLDMLLEHNIQQINHLPTRKDNVLDLVFVNEVNYVKEIRVYSTSISDHNIIELSVSAITSENRKKQKMKKWEGYGKYNFYSKNIKWLEINEELIKDWENIFVSDNIQVNTDILYKILDEIVDKYIPLKKSKHQTCIPRDRRILFQKIRQWKKGLAKEKNAWKVIELKGKIENAEQMIIQSKENEKRDLEERTLENIKKNPKLLYSYAKKMNKRRIEIGPIRNEGRLTNVKKEICNILAERYKREFTPRIDNEEIDAEIRDENCEYLSDIDVNEADIVQAINEIRNGSAAGPDGVPAILLKKVAHSIAKPLALLLRQSIDTSKIYDEHKLAYITPTFKSGSRLEASNYRPVSLTSHIMKIYERVMKKNIMNHLVKNNLFNLGQHGFVPGKSTQTQLLVHHESIYKNMLNEMNTDVVYLDFAKAFDKVDHNILAKKIRKHYIVDKVGRWIKEFLKNRKQIVIANDEKSDEAEVISGVPQGTVLAAVLFVIMIADIDSNVKESVVRSFADDTRISRGITCDEDRNSLQSDLNKIYEWAEVNRMVFNSDKFESINYGDKEGIIYTYRGPNNEPITNKEAVKDLGVMLNRNMLCKDQIEILLAKCKAKMGMLFRHFKTRKAEHMIMLYKTYVRSPLEYCNMIWYPHYQKDIAQIESVQRSFTARIEEVKDLDYWERLRFLKLYSLERRRERYMIIQAWKQIEGITENIMELKISERASRGRLIVPKTIPGKLRKAHRTLIHNAPASIMQRLFNALPAHLRNISGVSVDVFKNKLDKYLSCIPDHPRLEDAKYTSRCASNSLVDIKGASH